MRAYVEIRADELLETPNDEVLADLHRAYAADGFLSQYTSQTLAWESTLPPLKTGIEEAVSAGVDVSDWMVLLELPLYRLRRRVDLVLVTPQAIAVVELKVGEASFPATALRQVEEYALDLRDFHEHSTTIPILPVLWSTEASVEDVYLPPLSNGVERQIVRLGAGDFGRFIRSFASRISALPTSVRDDWSRGSYKPVPTVIEAATTFFEGHGVDEIAQADAANLNEAADAIVELIDRARRTKSRALIFLTGVPGSGKTLAGLEVVHRSVEPGERERGDVVYLSGNTPLVVVLQEALTEDEYRSKRRKGESVRKSEVRASARSRVQHIIDFLKQYLSDEEGRPPHDRAIVFDEAQRAWDEAYGKRKFNRPASEPSLLIDIMSRHPDWCVIVGLIGGGQEINSGENGMVEWGKAIRALPPERRSEWTLFGPPGMKEGDRASAHLGLGELPGVSVEEIGHLTLTVPLRSYRSPRIAEWVEAVLEGESVSARSIMASISEYPIGLTRHAETAQQWLREQGRGERRFGMVASSTASRLRAEGFGVSLNATDRTDIAHWYLKPREDVRSSFSLEVLANEYTTQGLELDFVGLCWGGDLYRESDEWVTRRFAGTSWNAARDDRRRFILNSYRVLLTRAREGLIIWVPLGDRDDPTRDPKKYHATAEFLLECGARSLDG